MIVNIFKRTGPKQVQLDTEKLELWILGLFLFNLLTMAITIAAYARTL